MAAGTMTVNMAMSACVGAADGRFVYVRPDREGDAAQLVEPWGLLDDGSRLIFERETVLFSVERGGEQGFVEELADGDVFRGRGQFLVYRVAAGAIVGEGSRRTG